MLAHFEFQPFDESAKRSVYHVRESEIKKLSQISEPIDIFLSHDWPTCMAKLGDTEALIRKKPGFAQDIAKNQLGNPELVQLVEKLKPKFWFSAHLHVKFSAIFPHSDTSQTKFLALDKVLPRRQFMQILEIPEATGECSFSYDLEWLAITKAFDRFLSFELSKSFAILKGIDIEVILAEAREWIEKRFGPDLEVLPFEMSTSDGSSLHKPPNPQTKRFLEMLELSNYLQVVSEKERVRLESFSRVSNPDQILLDDDDDD